MNQSDFIKVLLVLSIPYIATSLINNGFPALLPFVREEFALSRAQVGYYSSSFFLSAAVMAVFTGSVVDRLGPKRGLLFGVACLGFMILMYGFSPSYPFLLVLALFAGLGFSIVTPSVNKGVMVETPPEKRAFSMGIMQSGIGVGGFAGASLLPLLGESLGWRLTIQGAGLVVLIIGFTVYKLYRENTDSNDYGDAEKEPESEPLSIKENMRFFLSSRQFLLTCLLGTVIAGSSMGAILSHFAVFLSEDLYLTPAAAGLGLGFFQIGGVVGRPVWGWFSDRFLRGDRAKTLSIIGVTGGLMFVISGFFGSLTAVPLLVYIFAFIFGFAAFGWGGVYFITIGEFAGENRTGGATGLSLLFIRTGVLAVPPLFGAVADLSGDYSFSWVLFGTVIILFSIVYYLQISRYKKQMNLL